MVQTPHLTVACCRYTIGCCLGGGRVYFSVHDRRTKTRFLPAEGLGTGFFSTIPTENKLWLLYSSTILIRKRSSAAILNQSRALIAILTFLFFMFIDRLLFYFAIFRYCIFLLLEFKVYLRENAINAFITDLLARLRDQTFNYFKILSLKWFLNFHVKAIKNPANV